jgi:hypothetical protein
MRRLFPALRASAAAALLFAATACLADRPALADDALASLQSAYAGAVTPGEQADLYRELLATVLLRCNAAMRPKSTWTRSPLRPPRW